MLSMEEGQDRTDDPGVWKKPILVTIAREGEGIKEVVDALEAHREFLERTGHRTALEEERWESIIREMLAEHFVDRMHDAVTRERFRSIVRDVAERRMDKLEALDTLLRAIYELEAAEGPARGAAGRGARRPGPRGSGRPVEGEGQGEGPGKGGRKGAPRRPARPSGSSGRSGGRRR